MYDALVVGAGPYGATFARALTDAGGKVLVVDRRDNVAGNCHTPDMGGGLGLVHAHGPHQFHCDSRAVWDFVTRFAEFNGYTARLRADTSPDGTGMLYSFPLNLSTFSQLWQVRTWPQAKAIIDADRAAYAGIPQGSVEGWCLANIGPTLYGLFIEGYTRKQWRRPPGDLPAAIVRRLAFRQTHDDRYFSSRWQGNPVGGFTALFAGMLEGIDVMLGVDYLQERRLLDRLSRRVVYTGRLDELFGYKHGELDYLSLRFEHDVHVGDQQGTAIVNYTHGDVAYTRRVEPRHFDLRPASPLERSVVTTEYPHPYTRAEEPYYPVNDEANRARYDLYREELRSTPNLVARGRLGTYRYLNMDAVIAEALDDVARGR